MSDKNMKLMMMDGRGRSEEDVPFRGIINVKVVFISFATIGSESESIQLRRIAIGNKLQKSSPRLSLSQSQLVTAVVGPYHNMSFAHSMSL